MTLVYAKIFDVMKLYTGTYSENELKNHGVSRGIKKLLTNGECPIRDSKSKLLNVGR